MALQTHPFDVAVEIVETARVSAIPPCARFLPVADGAVEYAFFVPGNEGITVQRGDVIADRAVHGILKIEHAGMVSGAVEAIRFRGM